MRFIILFFILSFSLFADTNVKNIYALVYGKSNYPSDLLHSENSTDLKEIYWLFYLIETANKKILVDTGFEDKKYISAFQISNYIAPEVLLKNIGIDKNDITDIVLTHGHFDHIGGIKLFPNAKIYINSTEYDTLSYLEHYKDFEQVLEEFKNKNQIIRVNKKYKIQKGIDIHFSGGHTIGSQFVHVHFKDKEIIFSGDECYFAKECNDGVGISPKVAYNISNNHKFINRLSKIRKKNSRLEVLTLHDSELKNRFGAPKNGVIHIFSSDDE